MPRRRLDPLEPDLTLEERQDRMRGYVLKLRRNIGPVYWNEDLTVTSLRSYNETSGILELFALTGRHHKKLDPARECGQARTINTNEIVNHKQGGRMSTATKDAPKKTEASKAMGKVSAKGATDPKGNRHEKREKALALREEGKTFKEIMVACGYANPGAAHNGVKRAKEAAAKA